MNVELKSKFEVGDKVFLGERFVDIIKIKFNYKYNRFEYLVQFDNEARSWQLEVYLKDVK